MIFKRQLEKLKWYRYQKETGGKVACSIEGKVQQDNIWARDPEDIAKEGVSKGRSGKLSKC